MAQQLRAADTAGLVETRVQDSAASLCAVLENDPARVPVVRRRLGYRHVADGVVAAQRRRDRSAMCCRRGGTVLRPEHVALLRLWPAQAPLAGMVVA